MTIYAKHLVGHGPWPPLATPMCVNGISKITKVLLSR